MAVARIDLIKIVPLADQLPGCINSKIRESIGADIFEPTWIEMGKQSESADLEILLAVVFFVCSAKIRRSTTYHRTAIVNIVPERAQKTAAGRPVDPCLGVNLGIPPSEHARTQYALRQAA